MRLHHLLDPLVRLGLSLLSPRRHDGGILLISAGGLGDTVLFSLILPRLAQLAQPGEPVTLLLRSDAARMAFVLPPHIHVIKVDFKRLRQPLYRWQVGRDLRQRGFRQVVHTDYLRHPDLDEFLVQAAGAPHNAAMEPRPSPKHGARLHQNRALYDRLFQSGPPLTDKLLRWSRFADFLTGRHQPPPLVKLAHPPAHHPHPVPTVLFQPFSAVAAKQCEPELWDMIARSLPHGWHVLLAGHPSDLEKNPAFLPLLDLPNVTFEGAPFAQLASIIAGCRLVVSVDTACMHLAVAVGTPTLCLASAAYVGEIVPYADETTPANAHFLYQPMDCQGCLGQCHLPLEKGMYPCVAALDADQVLTMVADIIARGI